MNISASNVNVSKIWSAQGESITLLHHNFCTSSFLFAFVILQLTLIKEHLFQISCFYKDFNDIPINSNYICEFSQGNVREDIRKKSF